MQIKQLSPSGGNTVIVPQNHQPANGHCWGWKQFDSRCHLTTVAIIGFPFQCVICMNWVPKRHFLHSNGSIWGVSIVMGKLRSKAPLLLVTRKHTQLQVVLTLFVLCDLCTYFLYMAWSWLTMLQFEVSGSLKNIFFGCGFMNPSFVTVQK